MQNQRRYPHFLFKVSDDFLITRNQELILRDAVNSSPNLPMSMTQLVV